MYVMNEFTPQLYTNVMRRLENTEPRIYDDIIRKEIKYRTDLAISTKHFKESKYP